MWKRALLSAALAAFPVVVCAFSGGPPIQRTGAPNDGTGQDCTACHRTYAPANSDPRGYVRINAVNYTPGQKQTIRVEVFHPEAKRWGFELTARRTSDDKLKSGTFTPNTLVQVKCDPSGNAPCGTDREFAQHLEPATRTGSNGYAVFSVEWTAPDAGSGDVIFYAAGNAADFSNSPAGDRIYTTKLVISQAPAASKPIVTSSSGVQAAAFGGGTTISPGSWIEIYGTALSNVTRGFATWDFTNSNAPTTLEGVKVTVAGKSAFVSYVSPGQVNAQVPDGIGTGPVQVVVTNSAGTSDTINMTAAARSPQFLAPPSFKVGGRQLAVALFPDGTTYVANPGEIPGLTSRPAKVGDTIILYGIGQGAVSPATPAGAIASGSTALANPVLRFGNAPATVSYAGLAPGFVGLYQWNVVVPSVAAGDVKLSCSIDGLAVNQDLTVVVGQ